MTGTVAQLISLVSYGNNYLRGGKLPVDYFPANSGFAWCQSVDFRVIQKANFLSKPKEKLVADDPEAWFAYLRKKGCLQLRLHFEHSDGHNIAKDHKLAGFIGGGGSWLIEAVHPRYSNYWANRWNGNAEAPNGKIWTVNYGRISDHQKLNRHNPELLTVKKHLNNVLVKIADFANDNDLENWATIFHTALQNLSGHEALFNSNEDVLCASNYTVNAKQLLAGASTAYVFGGMGSWNDLGFDTEEESKTYETLSEQLYDAINKAIVASVNSY